MTIRRDMEFLGQNNKIVRVFGGAKSVNSLLSASEAVYAKRSIEQTESKEQIARKALQLIPQDSAVFIGSGTTTAQLSRIFPNGQYFITTTGLNCAIELSGLPDISLMILGGTVNKNSFSVNGSIADKMLSSMHFNVAFLGVRGYIPGRGFTTSVAEDFVLRQTIVKNSDCAVILMDSTKFGLSSACCICPPDGVDAVVTDDSLSPEQRAYFEQLGITVI